MSTSTSTSTLSEVQLTGTTVTASFSHPPSPIQVAHLRSRGLHPTGCDGRTGTGAGTRIPVSTSWAWPDLHEKREVGCHSYTQFCSTAKFLQPNQIAAFRLECNYPDRVVASRVRARSRASTYMYVSMPIVHDVSLSVPRWTL